MQRGRKSNRILDYWIGTPLLNVLATFHRRQQVPAEIFKIGVMCSPALGDTFLFSGVLQDLRSAFPKAHIVHVCMRQNLAAAEIIPGSDERLVIDLTKPRPSIRSLRAQAFDVLLDFSSWQRLTAFYTLISAAKYTVGFRTHGQNRSRGYDRCVEHRNDCHELSNFRALLQSSGLVVGSSHHAPAVVVEDIAELPFGGESDLVVLHPWASGQRSWLREWPEGHWLELSERLARPETLFVVTGAPSDAQRMEPFVARLRADGLRAEPFVSPDGMRTLTHVLRCARMVVSVNTGVMHLAAIAGAPVVGLSGPTSNLRWGPIGPRAIGLQANGKDCGYLNLGFEFEGQATDCMNRITTDDVLEATNQIDAIAEEKQCSA
jgi:ADP-heptose:LPS heptosyltransferase